MCGIVGKINFDRSPVQRELVAQMCQAIVHRGPDDSGLFFDHYVGLGTRRLSIIDLNDGHMPMCNEDESVWITFNGEIYNFIEKRDELLQAGHGLMTRSDTEVILHLYEEYGIDCLQHLNGMFAFAIWDRARQRLFIARDRLGKKPLHYALTCTGLTFASEIAALLCDPAIPRDLDYDALDMYLTLEYIPSPVTIFKAIRKLPSAHYLVWEKDRLTINRYWHLDYGVKGDMTEEQAAEELRALLTDAIRRRLISDVPLGVFLSGGLDSTTVVALASQLTDKPIKTFSIGFENQAFNELGYARQVAQKYHTDHHEFIVKPDLIDVLPQLSLHYGEPFGDDSAVATYYVSKLARQFVTVALSGDGGDETFGGYPHYTTARYPLNVIPGYLNFGARAFLNGLRVVNPRRAFGAVKGTALGIANSIRELNDPMQAFANRMTALDCNARQRLYSEGLYARVNDNRALGLTRHLPADATNWDVLDKMFYLDQTNYMVDDILVKVDIASMANSLEIRCPILDYRIVEWSARLPATMKVRGTDTKRIMRQAFGDLWTPEIRARKKMGFGMPIDEWLKNDLYQMAHDLLTDQTARQRDLFDQNWIQEMLVRHKNGTGHYAKPLWLLLNFELWARAMENVARVKCARI
jgi:asparagine synthase (glutamine-hydrolysing)